MLKTDHTFSPNDKFANDKDTITVVGVYPGVKCNERGSFKFTAIKFTKNGKEDQQDSTDLVDYLNKNKFN